MERYYRHPIRNIQFVAEIGELTLGKTQVENAHIYNWRYRDRKGTWESSVYQMNSKALL